MLLSPPLLILLAAVAVPIFSFPDTLEPESLKVDLTDPDGHHLHLVEGDIGVLDEPGEEDSKDSKLKSGGQETVTGSGAGETASTSSSETAKEMLDDASWRGQRQGSFNGTSEVSETSHEKGSRRRASEVKKKKKSEKYAVNDNFRTWPNGQIPYTIDSSLWHVKSKIVRAMKHIESKTCVKFVPRTTQSNYVRIYQGPNRSCFSMIGRTGGSQAISLGHSCVVQGVIVHELMHAIGFYHMHSRSDRDSYLRILWDNINGAMVSQFRRNTPSQNRIMRPFDYDSIMLYGPKLFSRNGRDTMIPIRKGIQLLDTGVKNGLSDEDAASINLLYGCSKEEKKPGESEIEKEEDEANETHDTPKRKKDTVHPEQPKKSWSWTTTTKPKSKTAFPKSVPPRKGGGRRKGTKSTSTIRPTEPTSTVATTEGTTNNSPRTSWTTASSTTKGWTEGTSSVTSETSTRSPGGKKHITIGSLWPVHKRKKAPEVWHKWQKSGKRGGKGKRIRDHA